MGTILDCRAWRDSYFRAVEEESNDSQSADWRPKLPICEAQYTKPQKL